MINWGLVQSEWSAAPLPKQGWRDWGEWKSDNCSNKVKMPIKSNHRSYSVSRAVEKIRSNKLRWYENDGQRLKHGQLRNSKTCPLGVVSLLPNLDSEEVVYVQRLGVAWLNLRVLLSANIIHSVLANWLRFNLSHGAVGFSKVLFQTSPEVTPRENPERSQHKVRNKTFCSVVSQYL